MKWLADAFRQRGHTVHEVSRPHELDDADKWADVCVFQQRSVIRYPNLKPIADTRQSIWLQVWFDLIQVERGVRLSEQPDVRQFRDLMQLMDCVCVKELLPLDSYQQLRINTVYVDQGIPSFVIDQLDHAVPVPPSSCRWDVALWGQGGPRYSQRWADAKALVDAGFRVGWIGLHGQTPKGVDVVGWVPPNELPLLAYHNAKVVLSVGLRNDVEGYQSDSLWLAMASRRPVIKRSETAFATGPYLAYRTTDQLIELTKWMCDHPRESEELGRKAATWLRENKTLTVTVQGLESLIARIAMARDTWLSQQRAGEPFGANAFAGAPA